MYKESLGKAIFAGYLVRYKLDKKKINPLYLLYFTKSKIFKEWITSKQRISGQPNINGNEYLSAEIIVPPLNIQNEIAKEISDIYEVKFSIKSNIKSLKKKKKHLIEEIINYRGSK